MSLIEFESATEKEIERERIRNTRDKILNDAKTKYFQKEAEAGRAKERGDDKWMLPAVEDQISSAKSTSGKKNKKNKREKEKLKKQKHKKTKKKRRRESSSSSDSSNDDDDGESEWVEKETPESNKQLTRDEWMNLSGSFLCSEREKVAKDKKESEKCILDEPGHSSRELNPYWKGGGTGLPEDKHSSSSGNQIMDAEWLKKSLRRAEEQAKERGISLEEIATERWGSLDVIRDMIAKAEKHSTHKSSKINFKPYDSYSRSNKLAFHKPNDDGDSYSSKSHSRGSNSSYKSWRKPEANKKSIEVKTKSRKSSSESESEPEPKGKTEAKSNSESQNSLKVLTDDEMNKLSAKILKAEIMGDDEMVAELKNELEDARRLRESGLRNLNCAKPDDKPVENVILTRTNSKGMTKPLEYAGEFDEGAGSSGRRKRGKKVDTHESGKRKCYFADDDKYSLKEIFHREKGYSNNEDDSTFVKLASKTRMDMDELFEEKISREESDAKQNIKEKHRAINEHKRMEKSLDNCHLCIDSKKMEKQLIVSMGKKIYLSLPWHVSMTPRHCILSSIHHVSCQVQLDEDFASELDEYKKSLIKMCKENNEYPIFFEIFMNQHHYPHMKLECIPLSEDVGSMAPMYFKKALLECETEWSTNKKLVELKSKNLRQSIPKGLSYFFVDFGDHSGFAHVIEDETLFPRNFAQEIIGGMLDLNPNMWRKPRKENFHEQKSKVITFAEKWKKYDFKRNE